MVIITDMNKRIAESLAFIDAQISYRANCHLMEMNRSNDEARIAAGVPYGPLYSTWDYAK